MYKYLLVNFIGTREYEVPIDNSITEEKLINLKKAVNPSLYQVWCGDPKLDPKQGFYDQAKDLVWSDRSGPRLDELDQLVRRCSIRIPYFMDKVLFRARLKDEPRENFDRPLKEWPKQFLELLVPILLEVEELEG